MMVWVALSFLVGGAVGWWMARAIRPSSAADARTAAAEARVEELRQQVRAAAEGFDGLRHRLEVAEAAKVSAETRAQELAKHVEQEKALLDDAKTKLSDAFRSLASEALADNNQGFLTLAEQKFQALQQGADSDLASRQQAVEALVGPLREHITLFQREARELEARRLKEESAIGERLSSLTFETAKLANALRTPQLRGRWGENTLRRCAELSGMSSYCDFVEQASVASEEGLLRPDLTVTLPAGRRIIVDAKVPLSGYLEAEEATDPGMRRTALQKFAGQIRQHVGQLSGKEYLAQFSATPEFIVLFIPSEALLAAAAHEDRELFESALAKRVLIVTPTIFVGLMTCIAYGWHQQELTENAQVIQRHGQDLLDRLAIVIKHVNKVGTALGSAVSAYNLAAGSIERRLVPTAKKFKELGVTSKQDTEALTLVDQIPTSLTVTPRGRPDEVVDTVKEDA